MATKGMPTEIKKSNGDPLDWDDAAIVQGDLADGVSDTGTNPVKVGGVAVTTPTSRSIGSRITAWFGRTGAITATLVPQDGTIPFSGAAPGRGSSGTLGRLSVRSALEVYNGSTYDPAAKSVAYRLLSAAASDNAANIKASSADVFALRGYNAAASIRYLKIYNKSTAPTSSDTPFCTFHLPATSSFSFQLGGAFGAYLSSGLGVRLTTGLADNDTGALTAGDILALSIDYA